MLKKKIFLALLVGLLASNTANTSNTNSMLSDAVLDRYLVLGEWSAEADDTANGERLDWKFVR